MTIGLLLAIVSTLSLIVALLAVRPIREARRTSPGGPASKTTASAAWSFSSGSSTLRCVG
jgi:hypothetical protein